MKSVDGHEGQRKANRNDYTLQHKHIWLQFSLLIIVHCSVLFVVIDSIDVIKEVVLWGVGDVENFHSLEWHLSFERSGYRQRARFKISTWHCSVISLKQISEYIYSLPTIKSYQTWSVMLVLYIKS